MTQGVLERVVMAALGLCALIGLAASGSILLKRHAFENRQNKAALVIDAASVQKLARLTGREESWWFRRLERMGYEDLALEEDTLESLQDAGLIQYVPGYNLIAWRNLGLWRDQHPIQASRVYALSSHSAVLDRLEEGFKDRFLGSWQRFFSERSEGGGVEILEIPATLWDGAGKMGFGFGAETVSPAMRKFRLYPRLNNTLITPEMLAWKIRSLGVLPAQGCLIFSGMEVPGFPGEIADAADLFRELKNGVCVAELVEMDGLPEFKSVFKGAFKLHSVTEEEMRRFSEGRFVQRFARAVSERDVRVLYVRAVTFHPKAELEETNLRYFKKVIQAVKAQGFTVGPPSTFAGFDPSPMARRMAVLGLWSLGVLFGLLLLPRGVRPLAGSVALAGGMAWLAVMSGLTAQMLLALAGMIGCAGFPALALGLTPSLLGGQPYGRAAVAWLLLSLVSLMGGLMVAGAFSTSPAFTGDIIFKGPKATLFVPILIAGLGWCLEMGEGETLTERLGSFLKQPLNRYEVAAGVLLLAAAVLMVVRSGNDTGVVSGFELVMRDKLEAVFGVRPRTKEFLFGHPAMLAGLTLLGLGKRGLWVWALLIFGVMGQASVLNTYCHFHTPIVLSVTRSVFGVLAGGVFGLLMVTGIALVHQLGASRRGRA